MYTDEYIIDYVQCYSRMLNCDVEVALFPNESVPVMTSVYDPDCSVLISICSESGPTVAYRDHTCIRMCRK